MNNITIAQEDIAYPTAPHCIVSFDFGIAEADTFNFLDKEEINRLLKATSKCTIQIMDFLCIARYYKIQDEKRRPLRFDYYLLRFTFGENSLEIRVFHERGPRYTSPLEIVNLFSSKINENSPRKILRPLDVH